jgi:hypothetical protein
MKIWRMRFACWTPKATNTLSEYVKLIAFPKQQWLHERISRLRYMHIAPLVYSNPFCLLMIGAVGFVVPEET